ncbi:MAG: hypothetical protein JNM72_18745 [Deltaproteobacteria bacterium]|nr:hypothetical protein [Deltaproteobacteria bacterium]
MKVYYITMKHGKRWPNIVAATDRPSFNDPHARFDPVFHTYDPSRVLEYYRVAGCLGCFSSRVAGEVRSLCGSSLVEYPVTVNGLPYHLFVTVDPIDAFDLERTEFEYLPGREAPISIRWSAFREEVVGEAPRIFLAMQCFGPYVNGAGRALLQSLGVEGIDFYLQRPPPPGHRIFPSG